MKRSKQTDFPEGDQAGMEGPEQDLALSGTVAGPPCARTFGSLKPLVLAMGDSFNAELEDFGEYGPLEPVNAPALEAR